MNTGMLHLHSFLPYLLLTLLVAAVIGNASGWLNGKGTSKSIFTISKVAFILSHVQLLVGMYVWFINNKIMDLMAQEGVMKSIMSEPASRLKFIEHPTMMIIAIILLTIGYVGAKKLTGAARAKRITIFYGIALVLILARIPWQAWLG